LGEVRPLEEMENEIIRFAIAHYRGQMSEVARRLKIGRSTLYRKLDDANGHDGAATDRPDGRLAGNCGGSVSQGKTPASLKPLREV
jgi:hypothetical protein